MPKSTEDGDERLEIYVDIDFVIEDWRFPKTVLKSFNEAAD